MKPLFLSGIALLVCTAGVMAQGPNTVYTDGPSPVTTNRNAFPWGSEGIRYQQIVPGSLLGTSAAWINDIYVTGDSSRGVNTITYGDIEIRMGLTTQVNPAANWATNNPNPVTVYRGPLIVKFDPTIWRPIGLPSSYQWNPSSAADNLCIEIIIRKVDDKGSNGSTAANFYFPQVSTTQGRAYLYQWSTNPTGTPRSQSGSASRLGLVLDDGNFVTLAKAARAAPASRPWPRHRARGPARHAVPPDALGRSAEPPRHPLLRHQQSEPRRHPPALRPGTSLGAWLHGLE
jgi:hypothetical protein